MTGTRFRLFVQPPTDGDLLIETVTVSAPLGRVGPGPEDERMYAVEPIGKPGQYGRREDAHGRPYLYVPPWDGPRRAGAAPDPAGHFDHLVPGEPGFEAAHLFGAVRFTLDVLQKYLDIDLPWHFARHFDRLELSILPEWDNAQFGYGYLEVGSHFADDGRVMPFSHNFDVIAHEVGHGLLYALVGLPEPEAELPEYVGFHESAADTVSLLAAMHFGSVLDDVLESTRGNLYVTNRLARIAELTSTSQIRLASNKRTMREFAAGFEDEHDLSEPLTGAMFDIIVDVFHEVLVAARLITPAMEDLADRAEDDPSVEGRLQAGFDRAYARDAPAFTACLVEARDVVGRLFCETLKTLDPNFMDYATIGNRMLELDRALNGGAFDRLILRNFRRRGIGEYVAGPPLKGPDENSHAASSRTMVPDGVDA